MGTAFVQWLKDRNKPPVITPAATMPELTNEQAADTAQAAARRRRGLSRTLLTGDSLDSAYLGRSSLLGS